ncbi:ABC transporter ATP-binding protein [Thalassolituus maritimus]|uniref:ABC transporter ATP-binding protein n=1 Tax=Thalassolituus maritimus TaxID=484498 RepID=UPI000E87C861|nr:ABC transporter ATP-binding protein [Thalassolituus maritimus]HBW84295.1 ABC transporter ATP-binding protein [Gammaproteobacteria bacterium]|tara:strand:- start:6530 stop:7228 length:699 start_codon:yes stop_codon:yes gene_type:complete
MSLLTTQGLVSHYGDFQALYGLDFAISSKETVAIIGSNGAGKSTFLRSIVGLINNASDQIQFKGEAIGDRPADEIVKLGIAMVPEGRRLFPSLSVEENLILGNYSKRAGDWNLKRIYELFPILGERRNNPGTALSGGQQQMVAIGRALMSNPEVLLCDEISLGLAPTTIKDIYAALPEIQSNGTAVLVVEQDINQALSVADRFYCFQEGRTSLTGKPGEVSRDAIKSAYFGL